MQERNYSLPQYLGLLHGLSIGPTLDDVWVSRGDEWRSQYEARDQVAMTVSYVDGVNGRNECGLVSLPLLSHMVKFGVLEAGQCGILPRLLASAFRASRATRASPCIAKPDTITNLTRRRTSADTR